jgi:valyl-tRNA synthetase
MEISKIYNPGAAEDKWYKYWMDRGFFHSEPDEREPYTIVMPPPNVTGILHMGHVLNNTIQDVLIRRARMQGKNACWVPGTDHASIATEAKVVNLLKEKGISKQDITREEFLKHAWEWKEKYGGIILDQIARLGYSCDWERLKFTMDPDLNKAVVKVFVDLHKKGYIYRGVRMVNWDPKGLTAVSDEEVIHKEVDSRLFYVRYKIEGTADEWITIATTRPETILGDTAVCVHPDDKRYHHLKGKKAIIPIVNRVVPIITDTYITMEFGTGALKVTPAHDINDYNLGIKHNLPVIDVLNPDGTMSKEAQFYVGEDRFVVRSKIAKELEKLGNLVKIEQIKNKVGFSERTDAVIEPKLSIQWFLKMDKVSKPALDCVMNGTVKLIPEKFINTYRHWMENVHDWCISRQLWWGQQIPAWYCTSGKPECREAIVSETTPTACPHCGSKNLRRDEDVVDTWFSSWLWPISVFNGIMEPENKDIKYYYPTSDLVTAPEILFFWVARMIIAGYEYTGKEPFKNVYLTGIVRDKLGRKMSKSLGNSPDLIELIEKHGADGVRVGMLLCSPAGNDLPFDESLCEQGRNFANKLWNAFRLIQGWEISEDDAGDAATYTNWFENKLSEQIEVIEQHFAAYRISEALMAIYKLVWDDFCALYLELIKSVCGKTVPRKVYDDTIGFLESLLKLLHPFTPFITEEIWHTIKERKDKECIIVASYPKAKKYDTALLANFELQKEYIRLIRNTRQHNNLPMSECLDLDAPSEQDSRISKGVMKLTNSRFVSQNTTDKLGEINFFVGNQKFSVIIHQHYVVDKAKEKEKLISELEYHKGFLKSVQAKLANERFVSNAKPEIVQNEKNKQADAEAKIEAIQKQLEKLS